MNYEKKYKKSLERAKKLYKDAITLQLEQDIKDYEYIFPELVESEDEKIRKELLESFKYQQRESRTDKEWLNGIKLSEVVAWLEKQGEKKATDTVEPKFKVGDWIISKYMHLVMQILNNDNESYKTVETDGTERNDSYDFIERNFKLWTIQDAKDGDMLVDDLGNICIYKESSFSLNSMYYSYCYGNYKYFVDGGGSHVIVDTCPASKEQRNILFQKMKEEGYEWDTEKKELKKINTVQPKFHEGDWVVYECGEETATLQITRIVEGTYEFSDDSTLNVADEDTLRLWNISDAKDGDVLYSLDSKQPFIFKHRKPNEQAAVYCGINTYGKFFIGNTKDCVITTDKYIPATKEQCDTLFKAMTEAGYEWDFEKKELKLLITNGGDFESPTCWSKEDEDFYNDIIKYFSDLDYSLSNDEDDVINWLKSIKKRNK